MSFFTDAEIAQLRVDQQASFPETASVITVTRVPDSMGGWTLSETGTASVSARRQPTTRASTENVQGGAVYGLNQWMIGLPHGTIVTVADIIRFADQDYQVKGLRAPRSYEYGVWCDCTTIT